MGSARVAAALGPAVSVRALRHKRFHFREVLNFESGIDSSAASPTHCDPPCSWELCITHECGLCVSENCTLQSHIGSALAWPPRCGPPCSWELCVNEHGVDKRNFEACDRAAGSSDSGWTVHAVQREARRWPKLTALTPCQNTHPQHVRTRCGTIQGDVAQVLRLAPLLPAVHHRRSRDKID